MTFTQIIKQGTTKYNKFGYRLNSVISVPVPKEISDLGVHSIKQATIKHKNGVEKLVETWLDKDGKIKKTVHKSSNKPSEKIETDYKWLQLNDDRRKDNRYFYENMTGKIARYFLILKDNSEYISPKAQFINLDINKKHKTVTKSVGTVSKNPETAVSEIYSIQKGEKIRGIKLKAEMQPNGLFKNISTNYFGISDEDAAKVLKDKYFYSRFVNNKVMAFYCVALAAKNQKINFVPKIFGYADSENISGSDYKKQSIYLCKNTLNDIHPRSCVINTLEHECRHLKQNEIVEKYLKGKLTNSSSIFFAKQYKEEFDNYVSASGDFEKYRNQQVEREAYAIGSHAERRYQLVTRHLQRIFKYSSYISTGA